jgi:hypothetical protein
MGRAGASTSDTQATVEIHETTLAKRVLNSNLSDEDKISLIQLIDNHPNIISIPSVWEPYPKPLNPIYQEHPEFIVTCSIGNDACPHVSVSCLNGKE